MLHSPAVRPCYIATALLRGEDFLIVFCLCSEFDLGSIPLLCSLLSQLSKHQFHSSPRSSFAAQDRFVNEQLPVVQVAQNVLANVVCLMLSIPATLEI